MITYLWLVVVIIGFIIAFLSIPFDDCNNRFMIIGFIIIFIGLIVLSVISLFLQRLSLSL